MLYVAYLDEYGKKTKRIEFKSANSISAGQYIKNKYPKKTISMFWYV